MDEPCSWTVAVLRQVGRPLEFVKVLRPHLTPGQVLVDLRYSGVCRSQLMETRGHRGKDPWLPHLLGHEGVGIVREVSPGVTKVAVGDRVVVGWMRGNGLDAAPPLLYTTEGESINAGKVTTFAEWTVTPENRVYAAPIGIDDRVAVLFGCALLTGAGMVFHEARPSANESVLISGLGGVGFAALIATQGLGVEVIAADPNPEKRRLAREIGAKHVIDPSESPLSKQVHEIFPSGVDVAIDAAGTTAGIEEAFESLRYKGGRLVFASHPPTGERISLDPHDLIKGRTIRGSWGGGSQPDEDIPRLARAITAASINLAFMTPRIYALDEVNQALDDLESQQALRPLIDLRGDEK